jgi:hypothetical protein
MFEIIRDYGYYKTDADDYIFLISIPIYIIFGIISYTTFIELLPIFSSTIDGWALTKPKKIVVMGAIISYICWIIYDINVKSYSCAITNGMIVISNISILLFNKELFKNRSIVNK